MNKSVSFLIGSLIGAAAGGIVGYILGQKSISDKCNADIESLREYYAKKSASDSNRLAKNIISKSDGFNEVGDSDLYQEPVSVYKSSVTKKDIADYYTKAYAPEVRLDNNANVTNNEINYSDFRNRNKSDVSAKVMEAEETKYLITPDEWDNDDSFDKVSLLYYGVDGVLTNTEDEIMSVNGLIGKDALDHFGDYEPNVLYVRNTDEETDYEILYRDMSFAEDIAGTIGGNAIL